MNDHEEYMADFMTVFAPLERWGPGTKEETLKALSALPKEPENLLEIGCGKGLTTRLLVQHTQATITALDNDEPALCSLQQVIGQMGLSDRVNRECASMTEMPFEDNSFDTIWAEGCAYIMGVPKALSQWRPLLATDGILMLSDLVWLTDTPSQTARQFWKSEYPDAQKVDTRIKQVEAAGYRVLTHFTLSDEAWQAYIKPLRARVMELEATMGGSQALLDLKAELDVYDNYLGEFGYEMFVLQRT